MDHQRDYYCNRKFTVLKVDLERKTTYNCDAAHPHRIDLDWLQKHPGQLFNTDINVHERQLMLQNIRNHSCEQNCWRAEDAGATSVRQIFQGHEKTHFDIRTEPEHIDFTLGSDCNLSCTYCCKEYSSSWRKDILSDGPYLHSHDPARYTISIQDRLLDKVSQTEKYSLDTYQTLLNEIENLTSVKRVTLTGGEPLLHNSLFDVLDRLAHVKLIKLFTGLGVNSNRLSKILPRLSAYPNVCVVVSIENIGDLYEFNRYGNAWADAQERIQMIERHGIAMELHSTLSNLTLFGFPFFYDRYKDRYHISFDMVYSPTFMPIYVMDDTSKTRLERAMIASGFEGTDLVTNSLWARPDPTQIKELGSFLTRFVSSRPKISLSVFPQVFLDWIRHNVV